VGRTDRIERGRLAPERVGATVGLTLILLAAGCSLSHVPPEPMRVVVRRGAERRVVHIRPGATVADALAAAHLAPREGQVRSVARHRALGPNGHLPSVRIRNRLTRAAHELIRPTTVDAIDGTDTTEGTRTEERPMVPPGLPDVLQYVQFAGHPGRERVMVGTRSGEVLTRQTLVPAVPAHRSTGMVLALTFDDGPDPRWTPQILDILKQKHVPATFCEVGIHVDEHPELTRRIVHEGHQLCNHTVHHTEALETKDQETIDAEIGGGRDALTKAGGVPPAFYRPPGGSLAPVTTETARRNGESVLYWAADPEDWKRPPVGDLVGNVVTHLKPGSILLLHDGGGLRENTVAALPAIIDFARALGYTFTVPISLQRQVG
jgi:peptidoglycan/xylan/chitin deacetylase (PgdA/CDA1 family)